MGGIPIHIPLIKFLEPILRVDPGSISAEDEIAIPRPEKVTHEFSLSAALNLLQGIYLKTRLGFETPTAGMENSGRFAVSIPTFMKLLEGSHTHFGNMRLGDVNIYPKPGYEDKLEYIYQAMFPLQSS
jgi:hypothetical protein